MKTIEPRRLNVPDDDEGAFRLGPRVAVGLGLALLLVGGAGGWAATAELSGAVVAQGAVTIDENLKSIQHRDGGIVSAIAVREGDAVRAGQVLIELDDAQTKAELSIIRAQLADLAARRARLTAERDGLHTVALRPDARLSHPESGALLAGEARLFEGNRANRESRKQQLELGIRQIGDEITGLEAQRQSKDHEIALVEIEHRKIKSLVDRQLMENTRVYTADRELARLKGERGEIDASIARAKTKMGEIRLQIIAVDEISRTEAQRELTLVDTKISELLERRAATEDRLARTSIRAPISGTVNELKVHTIGGVVSPAEVLVTIVPENARLTVEVKLPPVSIDQVSAGQPARLRFSAFNQRTTPELTGTVRHVSPATARDAATGETHSVGRIEVPGTELAKLGGEALRPGMPVEVYVSTEERTALSYLVKPLVDQFSRAFRER
jgi:HlyD family secretion protein